MSQKTYHVLSPDGFPIAHEPFASEQEAMEAIPVWCERFKEQGYYSTGNRERILLKELPDCLEIVPAEKIISFCC